MGRYGCEVKGRTERGCWGGLNREFLITRGLSCGYLRYGESLRCEEYRRMRGLNVLGTGEGGMTKVRLERLLP
jgi:hypothetical protein